MAGGGSSAYKGPAISHSAAFRGRRALNWFPMGLAYAFLYFGRYNLTVAQGALGELMTKEDFGQIFFVGTLIYGFAFILNGPLTDRIGGKRSMILALAGAAAANLGMGLYARSVLLSDDPTAAPLTAVFSALYALNMYFQSFGAVAIVKVNSHWFHVTERGGFSGIFGTMISSGIFFAFTGSEWVLSMASGQGPTGGNATWWVFTVPAALLGAMFVIELFLLRDRPGLAGHQDFDTGDASSGESDAPIPAMQLLKRILSNPIILTIALIEFCTGVVRNGVMHWPYIYMKEVWALPGWHAMRSGAMDWGFAGICAAVAVLLFTVAYHTKGRRRAISVISGGVIALSPFLFTGGWGGILFVAGVIGGNVAGWVSDLFFQSRRAPAAGGLYAILTLCTVGLVFALGGTKPQVGWVKDDQGPLQVGDRIVSVGAVTDLEDWTSVAKAIKCLPTVCVGKSTWDAEQCMCTSKGAQEAAAAAKEPALATAGDPVIPLIIERGGQQMALALPDFAAQQRAGDKRVLPAGPELTLTPYLLGVLVFLMSLCVIGTHGLLSGTATMDFGGRRAAATAVGIIDGFVYAGTALQSIAIGYITENVGWAWWPVFILPFSVAGFLLCLRIWNAKPKGAAQKEGSAKAA